ncbi:MAG: hypothetical protein ACR2J5_11900 [Geodermatophilaceae bacterium]
MTAPWTGVYPGAVPYPPPPDPSPPPPVSEQPAGTPVESELLNSRELFVQRMIGGGLMMVLLSITGLLWGIDGAFRILFTVYTVWAAFWLWALFVKGPPI